MIIKRLLFYQITVKINFKIAISQKLRGFIQKFEKHDTKRIKIKLFMEKKWGVFRNRKYPP